VSAAVGSWVRWWVLLAALWLVLVDRTPTDELVAGALAAALGATGALLVRRQREVLLRPRARWLAAAWRPAIGLVADLRPLVRRLGQPRRTGALVELSYDAVSAGGEQAAHRVATALLGSLAPNTIVVAIDRERRVVIAHQLEPSDEPARDALPLGRGPG